MAGSKKTIGILGGMGPEATVRLFKNIVSNTRAESDSDHIPVIIVNDPKIPDRSAFIHGDGPTPVPAMEKGMLKLEKMGADFATIPCNTAHFFLDEIFPKVKIPVLNMIAETANWGKSKYTGIHKFGLLSTTGTYKTKLYNSFFEANDLEIVDPDQRYQAKTMEAIYGKSGIKAGYKKEPLSVLLEIVDHLIRNGSQAIICGCTEISLVLNQENVELPVLDPLLILAMKSISLAGYELNE